MNQTEIKKKAIKLLRDNDALKAPINVNGITKNIGISLLFEDLDEGVDGFLLINENSQATIAINKSQHSNRQRFTIAHELGHFFLHQTMNNLFVDKQKQIAHFRDKASSTGILDSEKEANLFAAELLMPKEVIEELIDKYKLNMSIEFDLSRLATLLEVSDQALTFRLNKLGIIE